MMKKLYAAFAFAAALGASALSPAFAQMGGMMGGECPTVTMMGQGMMGQGVMGQGMMGGHGRMGAMAAGRLAYLKAELAITDTQTDAWNEYADAVKTQMEVMQGMREGMMESMHSGSATDRMDARINGMQAMVGAMQAVKPATESLYAILTDEQKQRADQLIGMDCGAM